MNKPAQRAEAEVAMNTSRRASRCRLATACLFIALASSQASIAGEEGTKSAAAVKELAQAMDLAKLDSIATADPSEPGTFVAALYFPGAQLLVVSAKYAAPSLLVEKMKNKNYRDVYIDLNSASVAGTKVFVIDQSCDGLAAKPSDGQAADSFENGSKQLTFDGEWRKAKMSEEEYRKAFAAADERYARILGLLAAQARQQRPSL
jgi:hypothetical protein